MITFLPENSFLKSAWRLDYNFNQNDPGRADRLRNQITEVIVMLKTYCGEYKKGNTNHPVMKMWSGYELALCNYGESCLITWEQKVLMVHEGYRNELLRLREKTALTYPYSWTKDALNERVAKRPFWLGEEKLHSNHRAILLGKRFNWYSQFGWKEEPAKRINGKWPYYWPSLEEK